MGQKAAQFWAWNGPPLWHYRPMSCHALEVRTLQDGPGRDQAGVLFHNDLSSDHRSVVSRLLRLPGAEEGLRSADDRDLVRVFAVVPGDVPPWLSKTRPFEGHR